MEDAVDGFHRWQQPPLLLRHQLLALPLEPAAVTGGVDNDVVGVVCFLASVRLEGGEDEFARVRL